MARRTTKVARKPKKTTVRVGRKGLALAASGNTLIKDFKPKDPDVMRYGPEPSFSDNQPEADKRQLTMTETYNWYSRFCTYADAKLFLINYLEHNKIDKETVKLVRKAPDSRMIPTAGWIARSALRGLILEERQKDYIQACVDKLVNYAKAGTKDDSMVEEATTEDKTKNKVNIQEVMREKANDAVAEIEHMFDNFLNKGCPKDFDVTTKIVGELQSRNVLPQHVTKIINYYTKILAEYNEAIEGKCKQLNQAYNNYSKAQMKNKIKFIETVIAELNGYVGIKQSAKKVRAKKAVPVEKIVSRLKYCKSFKDTVLNLDLTSVNPVKLHQSSEAWVYDTKRRKLYHYVADQYTKCLIVKGNTIIGFDKKESGMKTLRKPVEQIKEIMGSKPAARKYFDNIKAVQAVPNGRFSDTMVILKAW